MKDLSKLLEQYKKLNFSLSIEDEHKMINRYVYHTNKLEGNKLNLSQTTSLLDSGRITGENISLRDILEHKGMHKAILRVFKAVRDKEGLSLDLIKELNGLTIGSYFKSESSYLTAKNQNQKLSEFKKTENAIKITRPDNTELIIDPLSSVKNVETNMKLLVKQINFSTKPVIEKAAFLAQELWLHQPFIDGNKRTGRLLVNFLTMREKYPLFIYESQSENYNNLLVEQYLDRKPNLVINYIVDKLKDQLQHYINLYTKSKGEDRGFRMML